MFKINNLLLYMGTELHSQFFATSLQMLCTNTLIHHNAQLIIIFSQKKSHSAKY